jgi:hypothetical protein
VSDVPPLPPQPPPPSGEAPPALPGGPPPLPLKDAAPLKDSVGAGVLRLLLLHLLQIPLSVVGGPIWIGLSQLFYVVPQHFAFKRQGRFACIRGLWIGAGVTFLLNAGCFGLVILMVSNTTFR